MFRSFITAVGKFVTAPARFSLAGKVASLLFLFLLSLVICVWILLALDRNVVAWSSFMSPGRVLLVLALVVITPIFAYYAVRLWLEGERPRFPDIDFAWQAGLRALEQNGIRLETTPIFLVLGSSNEQQEYDLLSAGGVRLRVDTVPEGPAALHWYANPDAIFLFCTDTSALSAFNALGARQRPQGESLAAAPRPAASAVPSQARAAPAAQPQQNEPTGTIMLDQFVSAEEQPPAAGTPPDPRGTIVLDAAAPTAETMTLAENQAAIPLEPVSLSAQEAARQQRRLEYVCQLLRLKRQPLCPLNGVLALLPFEHVQASPVEAEELQQTTKTDLATMQRVLKLRFPLIAMITGMERERGFRELVRRVGRDRATAQRFGRKLDVRALATHEELESLSAHVCGTFEDWIYTLFREPGALARPGNTRLYSLLCKIRCTLKARLSNVLAGGFGWDPQAPQGAPLLFSGCYFAATGHTPDRQAFVRGVIEKLVDEQELVEWTASAIADERRYRLWATLGIVVCVALLALLVAMFLLAP